MSKLTGWNTPFTNMNLSASQKIVIIGLFSIFTILSFVPSVSAQNNTQLAELQQNPIVYFAPYYWLGKPEKGFEDFSHFFVRMPNALFDLYYKNFDGDKFRRKLKPDSTGRISIKGELIVANEQTLQTGLGLILGFKKSNLIINADSIKLYFETRKLKGINYSFIGTYVKTGKVYPNKESMRLEGTITKYRFGVKVAEAEAKLFPQVTDAD
jgi:hypothetical protein